MLCNRNNSGIKQPRTHFGVFLLLQVTRKLRVALKYAATPEDFISTQCQTRGKAHRKQVNVMKMNSKFNSLYSVL